ncbi:hypothetical protein BHE74_00035034, partial [Ensete ventricosum]
QVTLFFTESPTNPFLRCIDIELVSRLCHNNGALVCIDGTFASPVNQKALALGADLVLHSATKFIAGHNDVIGGCISGSEELISKIRLYHNVVGGVLNPNAAYMILRGMKTLHLRVHNQNRTALRMAQLLEEHPKVCEGKLYSFYFFYIFYLVGMKVIRVPLLYNKPPVATPPFFCSRLVVACAQVVSFSCLI